MAVSWGRAAGFVGLAVIGMGIAGTALMQLTREPDRPSLARPLERNALVTGIALGMAGNAEGGVGAEHLGRYLRRPLGAGEPLDKATLAGAPALPAKPGVVWLGLPLERTLVDSGALNAGSVVAVCGGGAAVTRATWLGAIICEPAGLALCTGLVRATPAALASIATVENPQTLHVAAACDGAPPSEGEALAVDVISAASDKAAVPAPQENQADAGTGIQAIGSGK